jgi:hypothetical protein
LTHFVVTFADGKDVSADSLDAARTLARQRERDEPGSLPADIIELDDDPPNRIGQGRKVETIPTP